MTAYLPQDFSLMSKLYLNGIYLLWLASKARLFFNFSISTFFVFSFNLDLPRRYYQPRNKTQIGECWANFTDQELFHWLLLQLADCNNNQSMVSPHALQLGFTAVHCLQSFVILIFNGILGRGPWSFGLVINLHSWSLFLNLYPNIKI